MVKSSESPDEFEALMNAANVSVPDIDPVFVDRLDADLRVQHSRRNQAGARVPLLRRASIGLVAAAVVLAGVLGLSQLRADDAAVPLEVTGEPGDPAPDPGVGPAAGPVFEPTATPTATPTASPTASPTAVSPPAAPTAVEPRPATPTQTVPVAPPAVTPEAPLTPEPTAIPEPTATLEPTAIPEPTATLEPTPEPAATPAPAATPEPVPTPDPTSTPEPTATPTATPEPAEIEATCRQRTVGDVLGVTCTWQAPVSTELDSYRVFRTRNGAARELLTVTRPADLMAVDRDVAAGDTIIYVVQAVRGDMVVASSPRLIVEPVTG